MSQWELPQLNPNEQEAPASIGGGICYGGLQRVLSLTNQIILLKQKSLKTPLKPKYKRSVKTSSKNIDKRD